MKSAWGPRVPAESSGIAGRPESYFRRPDEQAWAARWGIVRSDVTFSDADYIRAAIAVGSTANGVLALRIMWGTMGHVVEKRRRIYPDLVDDADLLHRAFGHTRFIYLRRDDVGAQAVSWSRAEQTDVWFEAVASPQELPAREPRFDLAQIDTFRRLIEEHNAAWQEWFASEGIRPHSVRYEDLSADPVNVARAVLDVLGLELPRGRQVKVRHRRLGDQLNAEWIGRYRARQ